MTGAKQLPRAVTGHKQTPYSTINLKV